MKICVFGAGAVGGNLAARLAQDTRNRVCVVARGPTLDVIRRNGVAVETGGQRLTQRVTASDRTADLGVQDLVISTVKATQLADLARAIGPMLGPDTSVVFAQNGIPWWYLIGAPASGTPSPDLSFLDPGGELARAIPRRSIIGAVVETASSVISPGVVLNSSPNHNRLLLAHIDDSRSERLEMVRQRLLDASILSPPVPAIRRAIWQKLAANIVTAMTILVEEPTSTMLADSAMKTIAELLVREVASVAGVHGIQIDPVLPNAEEVFRRHWFSGAAYLLRNFTPAQKALMDRGLVDVAELGSQITLMELLDAVQQRGALGIAMNRFHEKYDLLLTPSLPLPAFEAGREVADVMKEKRWTEWTPFSYPFNLTQQPAASVPCGLTAAGLPVGLQMVGRHRGEAALLQAAVLFEQAMGLSSLVPIDPCGGAVPPAG